MNILKNKTNSILFISLIFCFAAVAVHAESGKRSLFVRNPGFFYDNYLSGLNNQPAAEKIGLINGRPQVSTGKLILEMATGIAGNVAFAFTGGSIGHYFEARSEHSSLPGAYIGLMAGSVGGSALGVYLVGNSGNARGKFGMALLGSFLGEVSAWLIWGLTTANNEDDWIVGGLSCAILPPIGAAILFNSSLRYRNVPEGNGLLNLNKDKLTLGIPDIQIRPLPVYGKNMKAEFQFKINMFSVVL